MDHKKYISQQPWCHVGPRDSPLQHAVLCPIEKYSFKSSTLAQAPRGWMQITLQQPLAHHIPLSHRELFVQAKPFGLSYPLAQAALLAQDVPGLTKLRCLELSLGLSSSIARSIFFDEYKQQAIIIHETAKLLGSHPKCDTISLAHVLGHMHNFPVDSTHIPSLQVIIPSQPDHREALEVSLTDSSPLKGAALSSTKHLLGSFQQKWGELQHQYLFWQYKSCSDLLPSHYPPTERICRQP